MTEEQKAREARAKAFASGRADADKENLVYTWLFFAHLKGAEDERAIANNELDSLWEKVAFWRNEFYALNAKCRGEGVK